MPTPTSSWPGSIALPTSKMTMRCSSTRTRRLMQHLKQSPCVGWRILWGRSRKTLLKPIQRQGRRHKLWIMGAGLIMISSRTRETWTLRRVMMRKGRRRIPMMMSMKNRRGKWKCVSIRTLKTLRRYRVVGGKEDRKKRCWFNHLLYKLWWKKSP